MTDETDIGLTREKLDVAAAVARVTSSRAGGIAVFLGTTRAQKAPEDMGRVNAGSDELVALDYHAY